jgi:hypothetical protein
VERLGLTIEDVDDREPAVLVFRSELELLAVVPCIGARTEFFDVFDGNWAKRFDVRNKIKNETYCYDVSLTPI